MSSIFKLCIYEFRIQMMSKKVWLGYLLGIVLILKRSIGYVQYAAEIGEPVNVLEAFIVTGNTSRSIMLLAVGWLLVISEAPFVNAISFYGIHRTKRKTWNKAMLLYIVLQAIMYFGILALSTMVVSFHKGYFANIWSYPFVNMVRGNAKALAHDVDFPNAAFPELESVFVAFGQTFALAVLYAILLGILLYVISQMTNRIFGPVAAFIFHFLGYELMQEGYGDIRFSLLARTMPAYQIGNGATANLMQSYLIFIILILLLIELSNRIIMYTDFKVVAVEEGES